MTQSSGRGEWHAHWPMVVASMAGLSMSSMAVYSIGLFIEPLNHEFGWSRAQVSAALSIVAFFVIPLSPFAGALIDRWGSRRLAIPGVIAGAISFSLFSVANGSLTQWWSLWALYAFAAIAIKATVWTAAVSSVFSASRGLALAAALSGAAVAQTVAPLSAEWLIEHGGWRHAFFWMGMGWGAVVLILVVFFFFDAHDQQRRRSAQTLNVQIAPSILTGLTLREALKNSAILRIGIALFIATTLGVGLTVHKVPILTAAGISRQNAALIAASAGVAGILGKLLTGSLLDRWNNGWIGGISLSLPAIACLGLLDPVRTTTSTVIAMLIFGYSGGAYLQVCTYLTGRYGGLRHFGKIFGVMASLMAFGSGVGPVIAGAVYDHFGSYAPLLEGSIPLAILAGVLVGGLGPYPVWNSSSAVAPE